MVRNRALIFLATGAYLGFIPVAPATFGSLAALPVVYYLSRCSYIVQTITTAAVVFLSIPLSRQAEKILQEHDSRKIICDEVSGYMVATYLHTVSLNMLVFSFIFFRMFDILKPFPAGRINENMKGGLGIVLDDLVAGAYANVALRLLYTFRLVQ